MTWLAAANSFCMDYLARMKATLHVTMTLVDSLPIPRLLRERPHTSRIVELAALLTCTGPEMGGAWDELSRDGWLPARTATGVVPGIVGEIERAEARAELDAIVARHLFGLSRDELVYVLDTFPIVHRNDEAKHGSYRTKERILERYDEYANAVETTSAMRPSIDATRA
jgi:hypothetical protein